MSATKTTAKNRRRRQSSLLPVQNVFDMAYEHKFWLQVLGDHMRFLLDSLGYQEKLLLERAEGLKRRADTLLDSARAPALDPSGMDMDHLTRQSLSLVKDIGKLKKDLLRAMLTNGVQCSLPPTFVNHMLDELHEYEQILNQQDRGHIFFAAKLWLTDATGHAAALGSMLDPCEKDHITTMDSFEDQLCALRLTTEEFIGYLRANLPRFPALQKLTADATETIERFTGVLNEMLTLRQKGALLGTLRPLLLDHMIREACYALNRFAQENDDAAELMCDPTQERIED